MATHDDETDIAVDVQHIAGTLVSPAPLVPGVLFVHGWGGSQEKYLARAREIAALGCVCLTFNLRSHAETEPQHVSGGAIVYHLAGRGSGAMGLDLS